jgi:hypothetical protein
MSTGGANPAGSGRTLRLDPNSLPVRYRASDAGADGRERIVELARDRVTMLRTVRGIPMQVSAPVCTYSGVAIRIVPPSDDCDGVVAVTLEHRDPALSVPLFVAGDGAEVSGEWQMWARVFGLPRLVAEPDGSLRDPFAGLPGVKDFAPALRRRNRAVLSTRRGIKRFRRKRGLGTENSVHRGEREIIARN